MTIRVLTGINTTGTLHLGNYCGAIRPCVRASRSDEVESFFFLADLHALIKCQDPARVAASRRQIAASWLAAGLDPEKVTLYRQSDIPEVPLLNWLLNCVCPKGLMNRAHAYKAALEANAGRGEDVDAGVSMGLFCYPVLMAADILMFNANYVPVGRDQIQHLEMARDMAIRFNNIFGLGQELFTLPYEQIESEIAILPGLDGRKMSKSYNNVIPLFEGGTRALREAIGRVVTDSRLPGEPKDPDSSSLSQIFAAFASAAERDDFRARLRDGLSWSEAKRMTVEQVEKEIGPMRERYDYFLSHAAELEEIMRAGAAKARAVAKPFMERLTRATGLLPFDDLSQSAAPARNRKKAGPSFRQYREKDGKFYFKLVDGAAVLFTSVPFESGREAGQAIAALRRDGAGALSEVIGSAEASEEDIAAALARLAD